jgi:DNA-directed RNA polymerase subunit RPC12/RpoP
MADADILSDRRGYLLGGLRELACDRCGVRVLVKKNSPQHTSVQWTSEAVRGCAEFATAAAGGRATALVATCASLRASIDRAAAEGHLEVGSP